MLFSISMVLTFAEKKKKMFPLIQAAFLQLLYSNPSDNTQIPDWEFKQDGNTGMTQNNYLAD